MSNRAGFDPYAIARPSLVFFGMRCAFSIPPLQAMIDAGFAPSCIVIPGADGGPPIDVLSGDPPRGIRVVPIAGAKPGIEEIARREQIPILAVRGLRNPELHAILANLQPDLIAVACFPWLLPAVLRGVARYGAVNVHPSLLPRWRGPEPLLWTFLAGDAVTGATVHLMDDGFDTGPILAQRRITVPDGVSGSSLEQTLAELGAELLVGTVEMLARGDRRLIRQDEGRATHARPPEDADFVFSNALPARRLYNLIRGVVPLWGPVTIRATELGDDLSVIDAVDILPLGADPPESERDTLVPVPCSDAQVIVRRASFGQLHPLTLGGAV